MPIANSHSTARMFDSTPYSARTDQKSQSDAHREFARHVHENVPDPDSAEGLSQCAINAALRKDMVIRDLLNMDAEGSPPWAPERVKAKWEPLEDRTWASEYADAIPGPPELTTTFMRNATDGLTYPQTILLALEKLNTDDEWTRKDTLSVHVRFLVLQRRINVLMCSWR